MPSTESSVAEEGEEGLFVEDRHLEAVRLLDLGARVGADHEVVSLLRHARSDRSAQPLDRLLRLAPGHGTERAGEHERFAAERPLNALGCLDLDPGLQQALDQPARLRPPEVFMDGLGDGRDRKSTRLNSSHDQISYAVFCLKKTKKATKKCVDIEH